jgi:hypothetical protein
MLASLQKFRMIMSFAMNWNFGCQEMDDAKVCATFTLVDSGFEKEGG